MSVIFCSRRTNGKIRGICALMTAVSGLKPSNDVIAEQAGIMMVITVQIISLYANKIGRLLGGKYPKGDCDELVQRYIDRHY